jgi:hypothetical protein
MFTKMASNYVIYDDIYSIDVLPVVYELTQAESLCFAQIPEDGQALRKSTRRNIALYSNIVLGPAWVLNPGHFQ